MDNFAIEKRFIGGESQRFLDDDLINFKDKPQILNHNTGKQQLDQAIICNQDEKRIRTERFVSNSIVPNRPFGDQYGFVPYFIMKAAEHLKLTKDRLPSKDSRIISDIVEKAASGLTREAIRLNQQAEGQDLADELLKVKDLNMKEVWKCCVHLYTKSIFLYKSINEIMRWIGDEKHKSIWEDGVETLGPFCLLLWDNPFNNHMTKPETVLYRGAPLSEEYVAVFKDSYSKDFRALHSFQAFTSCTRNRQVAEMFTGNGVLFIMRVKLAFTVDLKPYSQYPDEEEELLYPGSEQHHLKSTTSISPTSNLTPVYFSNLQDNHRDNHDKDRDDYIDFFDYNHNEHNSRPTRNIDYIRPFLALRYEGNIHRDGEDDDWDQH